MKRTALTLAYDTELYAARHLIHAGDLDQAFKKLDSPYTGPTTCSAACSDALVHAENRLSAQLFARNERAAATHHVGRNRIVHRHCPNRKYWRYECRDI